MTAPQLSFQPHSLPHQGEIHLFGVGIKLAQLSPKIPTIEYFHSYPTPLCLSPSNGVAFAHTLRHLTVYFRSSPDYS